MRPNKIRSLENRPKKHKNKSISNHQKAKRNSYKLLNQRLPHYITPAGPNTPQPPTKAMKKKNATKKKLMNITVGSNNNAKCATDGLCRGVINKKKAKKNANRILTTQSNENYEERTSEAHTTSAHAYRRSRGRRHAGNTNGGGCGR